MKESPVWLINAGDNIISHSHDSKITGEIAACSVSIKHIGKFKIVQISIINYYHIIITT